jgi:hypothetical protein
MADIQHSAITDPNIHEPKGITTASNGQVYVADGGGSGDWKFISGHSFGELYITNNSTAQTLAAASGTAVLNPAGAWVANGFQNVTLTPASGTITIPEGGIYQLNFWAVFETASISSGAAYNFFYAINGTPSTRKVYAKKTSNSVDTLHVHATGFASVTDGAILSMFVGGDGTSSGTNIIIKEAGLSAFLIDPS